LLKVAVPFMTCCAVCFSMGDHCGVRPDAKLCVSLRIICIRYGRSSA